MVEDEVGLDSIYEKEETKETDHTDIVDDRAVPNLSNPNPIHSSNPKFDQNPLRIE